MAFLALSTVFGVLFMTPLMLRDLNALETGNIGLVMFPGAMIGAIAGIMGGRFVDRKGSAPVVYTAMTLLMSGFLAPLHLRRAAPLGHLPEPDPVLTWGFPCFSPPSPIWSLPRSHGSSWGWGWACITSSSSCQGPYSAAFIGKLLDISRDHAPINPLTATVSAGPYSNLFLLLGAVLLCAALLFYVTLRSASRRGGLKPGP